MSRFYDIDEANATLGELGPILATLVEQRAELVRLRDHVMASSASSGAHEGGPAGALVKERIGVELADHLAFVSDLVGRGR